MKISSGIVAALTVCCVGPQELPPTSPRLAAVARSESSPYSLASTLVESLSMAASARDTLAAARSAGNPITDSMTGIVSQRAAISRLNEATSLLIRFRDAPDEPVRAAANELSGIYGTLAARLLKGLSVWEKLAKAESVEDIAALIPESSKNAADLQDAWRLLPLGVAAVTDALVDSTRLVDGRVSYLRLTRAERARLNLEIQERFPNVRPRDKGGQVVDGSIILFRGFLNGVWRFSDDEQPPGQELRTYFMAAAGLYRRNRRSAMSTGHIANPSAKSHGANG
jgi:hypothetical protein